MGLCHGKKEIIIVWTYETKKVGVGCGVNKERWRELIKERQREKER